LFYSALYTNADFLFHVTSSGEVGLSNVANYRHVGSGAVIRLSKGLRDSKKKSVILITTPIAI
jgi:hypothetical protein